MKRLLIAIALALICVSAYAAPEPVVIRHPKITGYVVTPVETDQCQAVQITFTLSNETDTTFFSQRPYTGVGYNLYESFADYGYRSLPDRYMIGVSLSGGADGYPYRWGFHGSLMPGRTTTILGHLTIVEVGNYRVTACLLRGGEPVSTQVFNIGRVTVSPCTYVAPPPPENPYPSQPIYPVVNGQYGYPPITPYIINGYSYVPAQNFLFTIGGNVYIEGPSVLINVPGYQLAMVPGLDYGYLNGVPINLPMPLYMFGGVPYVPASVIMPLLGGSYSWNPYDRQLFINSPWQSGYGY